LHLHDKLFQHTKFSSHSAPIHDSECFPQNAPVGGISGNVSFYLAGEGAEVEGLLEEPVTGEADVARALERPRVGGPLLQKHNFRTVYSIRLQQQQKRKKNEIEIKLISSKNFQFM